MLTLAPQAVMRHRHMLRSMPYLRTRGVGKVCTYMTPLLVRVGQPPRKSLPCATGTTYSTRHAMLITQKKYARTAWGTRACERQRDGGPTHTSETPLGNTWSG